MLTLQKHHEHEVAEKTFASLCQQAVYRGYANEHIYKHIHHIIRDLIELEILPKGCYKGRMPLAGIKSFQRAAISVPIAFVRSRIDEIALYCLSKSYRIDEVMGVLLCSAFIYASNNRGNFESITLNKGFATLQAVQPSMRLAVLRGEVPSLQLFRQSHFI